MHNFEGIVLKQCWGEVHGGKAYTSQTINYYGFIVLPLCYVNKLKNKFIITRFQQVCKIKLISRVVRHSKTKKQQILLNSYLFKKL